MVYILLHEVLCIPVRNKDDDDDGDIDDDVDDDDVISYRDSRQ